MSDYVSAPQRMTRRTKARQSRNLVDRERETEDITILGSHAVACYCSTFPDIMLTGPGVVDVDTKIRERLNDLNIVPATGTRQPEGKRRR